MVNREKKYLMYISFRAFDKDCLENAIRKIISSLKQAGIDLKGPVYLPTGETDFTFNRSPHIDKKSREQFKMAIHKRLIVLYNASSDTLRTLDDLSLSIGVEISLKIKWG